MLYFVSIVAQDVEQQTIEDIVEDSNTEVLAGTLAWPRNIQSRIDHIVQDPLLDVSQMGLLVWD
jgi:D-alanyl-D-alanine carboxypeptidase/D-alanyl-D-alanine-endopeptidase (penicillin-binding protein 4)